MVQTWYIQRGEHDEENGDHGKEQKLVAPEMLHPLLETLGHVEEGPAEVDKLPCEQEKDPSHGCVAGGSGAEDGVAFGRVLVVAVAAKIAGIKPKDYNGERPEHAAGHEKAVDDHVGEELWCKYSVFQLGVVS